MMRQPRGGFLGGGAMFRSMTLSPMQAALQQTHQMARHLEAGGAAAPTPKHAKADAAPKRAKPDLAPRDFVLPLDVDAEEVRKAIEAKLGGVALREPSDAPPILEHKAGGRVVVPARHLLRLGNGRFDRGRQFMQGLVKEIRARRLRRN